MRIFWRLSLTLFVGIATLCISDAGLLTQTLHPFAAWLKIDPKVYAWLGDAQARDEAETINLGDCLRGTSTKDWPAAYAAICDDLNAAMKDNRNAAPDRSSSADRHSSNAGTPEKRKTKEAALEPAPPARHQPPKSLATPPLPNPRAASIPRPAPAPRVAAVAPAKPVSLASACTLDERGWIVHENNVDGGNSSPGGVGRQLVRGRSPGVALLVPGACRVRSPVNGKVLFAGEFKGYAGVLIVALKGKRRLIIAGLGTLNVHRDDEIARGALIGTSAETMPPALGGAYEIDKGSLVYFDVRNRKGGEEEVPWLMEADAS